MRLATVVRERSSRVATEDRVLLATTHAGHPVLAVADGSGGTPGGARAAERVVARIAAAADRTDPDWVELLRGTDEAIRRDPSAGFTTAAIVEIVAEGRLRGASVGDGSVLVLHADRVVDLSEHQRRKERVGMGGVTPIPFHGALADGVLLVCSDGLSRYADEALLAATVRAAPDLDAAADALLALVRLRSGAFPDDVALVLARAGRS